MKQIIKVLTSLLITSLALSAMASDAPSISVDDNGKDGRYMFNVTLHTESEISGLLTRARKLSKTMRKQKEQSGIALVLHGEEIRFFTKNNYKRFKNIVDEAALLDADKVIDIKICNTQMKIMDIKKDELPAFIEIVPYGPAEEERLKKKGYLYL